MSKTGWRACVGTKTPDGFLVKPLFPSDNPHLKAVVGNQLPGTHHVGTSREFVIDYYADIAALDDNEMELMLELECVHMNGMEERWEWPAPTEAIVTSPIIRSIEIIGHGPRK